MSTSISAIPESKHSEGLGATCICCGDAAAWTFFALKNVPVISNAPCDTREAALAFPTGDIELAFCSRCGHVFNRAFVPDEANYGQEYDNSLHFSPRFQSYIEWLATDLVERLGLRDKDIIEIGCGKGDFLALLCSLGKNRGLGFDPTFDPERLESSVSERIKIVRDFYSEASGQFACDFLCCRQTLEHVPHPAIFLSSIRRALDARTSTPVFFEVPNALYTLRYKGIWDIIYEHVSYFWALPLQNLFETAGFSVNSVRETYDGQFLCIEVLPGHKNQHHQAVTDDGLAEVSREALAFGETFGAAIARAESVLQDAERKQQRVVIWGTGSKGVTFLNAFKNCLSLEYAVDINPHKQGKFVPGSGHRIVSPDFVREYQPSLVFLMNPIYRTEVSEQLAGLGLTPDIVAI
jgi:hypothetical protein